MAIRNPKVDAYIGKAPPDAQPILMQLRATIRKACPETVEDIKWGKPFFLYENRVLCATMAFKAHCALVFWKSGLIKKKIGAKAVADLKRLRKIKHVGELLSEHELLAYLKLAMHFNEPTTKLPPRAKRSTSAKAPKNFALALKANQKAKAHFQAFSQSKKNEYLYWLAGAKTDETRERHLAAAIDWISQGKTRNWKYEAEKKKPASARKKAE